MCDKKEEEDEIYKHKKSLQTYIIGHKLAVALNPNKITETTNGCGNCSVDRHSFTHST